MSTEEALAQKILDMIKNTDDACDQMSCATSDIEEAVFALVDDIEEFCKEQLKNP